MNSCLTPTSDPDMRYLTFFAQSSGLADRLHSPYPFYLTHSLLNDGVGELNLGDLGFL